VQTEDSEFKVFVVPVAVGVALQDSDLSVDCLQRSRADAVPVPVQPQVFADDERLAGALLDRLTHHVHILEIIADSFRLKSSLQKDKAKEQ
jgi:hypothetical protein